MSTRVDAEQIESTKSEKVLAFILAGFLLIGGIWAYDRVEEIGKPDPFRPAVIPNVDQQAITAARQAEQDQRNAIRARDAAIERLELAREEYRTALDAGLPATELQAAYEQAQADLDAAEGAVSAAAAQVAATRPAAAQGQEAAARAADERRDEERSHDRQTFILRLILIAVLLGGSYLLLSRQRRAQSRYLALGLAAVGGSAALAVVMAADYGSDTIDFEEVGPLAISLIGIALTVAAFVALQRYIARRIPLWRVRRRECPFCGHPAVEGEHCAGCGRQVMAPCAKCAAPRRVGSRHCANCGAA